MDKRATLRAFSEQIPAFLLELRQKASSTSQRPVEEKEQQKQEKKEKREKMSRRGRDPQQQQQQ